MGTKDMRALLNFIYSGQTEIVQEELEEFMALANSLQIQGLVGDMATMKIGESDEINKSLKKQSSKQKRIIKGDEKRKSDGIAVSSKYPAFGQVQQQIARSGNQYNVKNSETVTKEDVFIVALSEELNDVEEDISVFESSETDHSLEMKNTSNSSLTEYDQKVAELIEKNDLIWTCKECGYRTKNKGHVCEHVEKHITGYLHMCKFCDKTYSMKRTLRHHERECGRICQLSA